MEIIPNHVRSGVLPPADIPSVPGHKKAPSNDEAFELVWLLPRAQALTTCTNFRPFGPLTMNSTLPSVVANSVWSLPIRTLSPA